jgi:hypothetical protein
MYQELGILHTLEKKTWNIKHVRKKTWNLKHVKNAINTRFDNLISLIKA